MTPLSRYTLGTIAFTCLTLLWACTNGRFQSGGGSSGGGGGGPTGILAGFPNAQVNTIAINSANGDVYVGGEFTSVGSTTVNHIARYFSDGTLDDTFTRGSGFDNDVFALLLTNDQLYVGGDFTNYNGQGGAKMVRLQLDGAIDTGYNLSATPFVGGPVRKIKPAIFPSNTLLVGGDITSYGSTPSSRMIRLQTNGVVDTRFVVPGVGFDASVYDFTQILSPPTYQIMVVGAFVGYDGSLAEGVVLIHTNGNFNPAFTPANGLTGGGATGYAVERNDTDNFMVVGSFDNYDGVPTQKVVRLNTDPSAPLRTTNAFSDEVRALTPYAGNTYIAGGDFTSYDTLSPFRIARVDETHNIVGTFLTSGGFNSLVLAVAADATGLVYAGGTFGDFKGTSVDKLARLFADGTLDTSFPQQP